MDKAVNAVFAALIWHCQDIREELAPFGRSHRLTCTLMMSSMMSFCITPASEEAPLKATAGLLAAFSAAEAMRRELVSETSSNFHQILFPFLC